MVRQFKQHDNVLVGRVEKITNIQYTLAVDVTMSSTMFIPGNK